MTDLAIHPALSPRQLAILEQIYIGKSNKQIAATVRVSPLTVKNHLLHIYRKLDARNRAEAVYAALARGFLKLPPQARCAPLPPPPEVTDWITAGNLRISPSTRCAEVAGLPLRLHSRHLLLLAALAARPGMVFSRQRLLDHVVGADRAIEEGVIGACVWELRRALKEAGCNCRIRTVREHGYGLELAD